MAAAAVARLTAATTCRMRVSGPVTAATTSAASPVTVTLGDLPQQKRSAATATTTTSSGGSPVVVEKRAAAATAAEEEEVEEAAAVAALASAWREVQGAGDWRGMVEPLHPLLRDEVVRYGELVAACYRAFDLDPASKRYLNCKHGKKQMLPAVGMAGAGYTVTRYIYAAPDVALPFGVGGRCSCAGKSRWIGYVAVASNREAARLGRRDILVSFRGTVTGSEWLANFMSALSPARFDPADPRPDVRVESGFLSLYTSDDLSGKFTCGSCRNQLLSEVTRLIDKYKHDDVSITLAGHSMGSSLAILLGYDLAELGLNRGGRGGRGGAIPITVFSFGGPRVGNLEFKRRCDELGVKVLRVANARDPVTRMPGVVLNEAAARVFRVELPWSKACYTHVGVEVALDFFKASHAACVHDLDAYINHLLDGGAAASATTTTLESWRWQMAAIRAGEWLQTLGI
ncbi:hypothetical protein OsI_35875 [Oryza sativa Indica Group]|uniref:Phospholipase A1 EG1, chloroplastic/mitochondrial n=1 Tax=Oryza sativa subsp. indica TaxID=39946 RepID=A2ZDK9_ORYSI|nr:hypothetical protein OsI_35875 [Oryza sativa Indica Group]